MSKNVMIPLSLLDRIIELLDDLYLSEYHELCYEYSNILWALRVKKQKLELRDAYAKIISADDPYVEERAHAEYLRQRIQTSEMDNGLPF